MMMMMMMLPIHFHYAFNIRCFLLREFVVNVCLSGILIVMPIAVQCGQWKKTMMMEWDEGWIDQPYHRRRAHWNDEVKTMVDIGQLKQMLNHMVKRFVPLHIRAGVYRWYAFLFFLVHSTEIHKHCLLMIAKYSHGCIQTDVHAISQYSQNTHPNPKQSYLMLIYQSMFIGCTWIFNQAKIAKHCVHSAMQHIWRTRIFSSVCVCVSVMCIHSYFHFVVFYFWCVFFCHVAGGIQGLRRIQIARIWKTTGPLPKGM